MKINYIAYLDPFRHFNGGGEMIMRSVIECGRRRGHDIKITSIDPPQRDLHSLPDMTILCDVFNCPGSLRRRFSARFLSKIIRNDRFIHFDNAYVDCCDMPYLPCGGRVSDVCPFKKKMTFRERVYRRGIPTKCSARRKIVRRLYAESEFNVFLSVLHHKTISSILGIDRPYFLLKPTIDFRAFKNTNTSRDIDCVFAGVYCEAKGSRNLMEYFKNRSERLVIIGPRLDDAALPNFEFVGKVPYTDMPKYFNRAKTFVYLPRWPEPQGRVVVEAALCGCRLETNEMVGATSFGFDIENPANFSDPDSEFWQKVEETAGDRA